MDAFQHVYVSSKSRDFDLADGLMGFWPHRQRTVYFSLCGRAEEVMSWDVEKLEARIRYDLNFDHYSVRIDRLPKRSIVGDGHFEFDLWDELYWRLRIRER